MTDSNNLVHPFSIYRNIIEVDGGIKNEIILHPVIDANALHVYREMNQTIKKPLNKIVREIIEGFVAEGKPLTGCTFEYIRQYVDKSTEHARLAVACGDYGFTIDELQKFINSGMTSIDIAKILLSR